MSKSLGNLVFVTDLVPRFEPAALRLYLMSHHYRDSFHFVEDDLRLATERLRRLQARAAEPAGEHDGLVDAFRACLEEDFDVPRALEVLEESSGPTARELAGVLGLSLAGAG